LVFSGAKINKTLRFSKKVWVSYLEISSFVLGYAYQLICQVSPWLLYQKLPFIPGHPLTPTTVFSKFDAFCINVWLVFIASFPLLDVNWV
jgi:hypothetical protein